MIMHLAAQNPCAIVTPIKDQDKVRQKINKQIKQNNNNKKQYNINTTKKLETEWNTQRRYIVLAKKSARVFL